MTNVLCCTALDRSLSPPTPNARVARDIANKRSLDKANTRKQRLSSSDEIELNNIFVAASLPEDHPHAVKLSCRKPGLDESIIRSPTLGSKLRKQLSRKSLATSKSLRNIKTHSPKLRRRRFSSNDLTINDLLGASTADDSGYDPDAFSVRIKSCLGSTENLATDLQLPKRERPSILPSFEWLVPRIDE